MTSLGKFKIIQDYENAEYVLANRSLFPNVDKNKIERIALDLLPLYTMAKHGLMIESVLN